MLKKLVLLFCFFNGKIFGRCNPATIEYHLNTYDIIIKGKYLCENDQCLFKVEDVYKGKVEIGKKIKVKINLYDTDFSMKNGISYVVYIKIKDGKYETGSCTRMGPTHLGRVKGDINFLESRR